MGAAEDEEDRCLGAVDCLVRLILPVCRLCSFCLMSFSHECKSCK